MFSVATQRFALSALYICPETSGIRISHSRRTRRSAAASAHGEKPAASAERGQILRTRLERRRDRRPADLLQRLLQEISRPPLVQAVKITGKHASIRFHHHLGPALSIDAAGGGNPPDQEVENVVEELHAPVPPCPIGFTPQLKQRNIERREPIRCQHPGLHPLPQRSKTGGELHILQIQLLYLPSDLPRMPGDALCQRAEHIVGHTPAL